MTNVAVVHAGSGVITTEVVRSAQISPNIRRVTIGGPALAAFEYVGYDQWFRLLVPDGDDVRFDNVPDRIDEAGYARFLALPERTRPVLRNYTVRNFRRADLELDIDFVLHGDDGVAGTWSTTARPGDPVGFIDQGCGFLTEKAADADELLIVADETAMPAVLGVLRSLPESAQGLAIIELADPADRQPIETSSGVRVQWITRASGQRPGAAALAAVRAHRTGPSLYGFAVGESTMVTDVRRHLVRERGVGRDRVTFCGYYKAPADH